MYHHPFDTMLIISLVWCLGCIFVAVPLNLLDGDINEMIPNENKRFFVFFISGPIYWGIYFVMFLINYFSIEEKYNKINQWLYK